MRKTHTESKWQAQSDGAREANAGKKLSRAHRNRISRSRKGQTMDYIIMACKIDGSETLLFQTMSDCAKKLGCSKQLISQCVRRPETFKSAMGYVIGKIDATR